MKVNQLINALTVDLRILNRHKYFVLTLMFFTISFYSLMIKHGYNSSWMFRGVSLDEFKAMNAPFPFFWHWFLIWNVISLYPLIDSVTKKYCEQCLLKINSRIVFWITHFISLALFCILLNSLMLLLVDIFWTDIAGEAIIVFILGQIIIVEVCLLISNVVSLKIAFGLTVLFPILGIDNYITWLPANFLMQIRVQEAGLDFSDVLGRELLFLLCLFFGGWVICVRQQYYSVNGGQR